MKQSGTSAHNIYRVIGIFVIAIADCIFGLERPRPRSLRRGEGAARCGGSGCRDLGAA
jgi:hypothetical protein